MRVPRKAKLGERPTILDSHSDKVLKNFIDQSETKRCTKKSDPIFRCTTPSTGKRLGVQSRRWYTTPLFSLINFNQRIPQQGLNSGQGGLQEEKIDKVDILVTVNEKKNVENFGFSVACWKQKHVSVGSSSEGNFIEQKPGRPFLKLQTPTPVPKKNKKCFCALQEKRKEFPSNFDSLFGWKSITWRKSRVRLLSATFRWFYHVMNVPEGHVTFEPRTPSRPHGSWWSSRRGWPSKMFQTIEAYFLFLFLVLILTSFQTFVIK